PRTLPAAVAELVKHGDEAKVLAGGHSLIPLMKLRLSTPSFIVDIGRIKDLNYIREADGHIAFGALTTHHDIEFSDLVKRRLPVLSSAASQIGDPQVRNRGTIGGAAAPCAAAPWSRPCGESLRTPKRSGRRPTGRPMEAIRPRI